VVCAREPADRVAVLGHQIDRLLGDELAYVVIDASAEG
jgi:hypothetical protein